MKKFLGTTMLALVNLIAIAQPSKSLVQGTVTENNSKTPVAGAVIRLSNLQTLSDEKGYFSLGRLSVGKYELTVSSLNFKTFTQSVTVGGSDSKLSISLTPSPLTSLGSLAS